MKTEDSFLIIVFISILMTSFIVNLMIPAYQSTLVDCMDDNETKTYLTKNNLIVAGNFKVSFNETTNETKKEINNFINESHSELRSIVQKHEECHRNQFIEGRMGSCRSQIRLYFNELECYILEKF